MGKKSLNQHINRIKIKVFQRFSMSLIVTHCLSMSSIFSQCLLLSLKVSRQLFHTLLSLNVSQHLSMSQNFLLFKREFVFQSQITSLRPLGLVFSHESNSTTPNVSPFVRSFVSLSAKPQNSFKSIISPNHNLHHHPQHHRHL